MSDYRTKIDLASRIFNIFSKILMLRTALSALSNVVNKLSNKILCHTCVIPCCFFVVIFSSGLVEFHLQADEVCGLAHVL